MALRIHHTKTALFVCVGLVVEAYFLGFHITTRVESKGEHRVLLTEFGAGVPLTETFTVQNNGFKGIRVRLAATEPSDATFNWRLSERRGESAVTVIEKKAQVLGISGEKHVELLFPELARSGQKTYELEIRAIPPTSKPVAAVAWLDDALPGAAFKVGGEERWGDLAITTIATGDTIRGRVLLASASMFEGGPRGLVLVGLALAIYNVLLVAFVIHFWPPARAARPVTEPVAAYRWPPRRIAVVVIVCVMTAATTVFANYRRRPAIDLIDELHTADLRSTLEMHVAFVVADVVVSGEVMHSIAAHPQSEITWAVVVPPGARLRTAIATVPQVWSLPGDGVVFRIGVAENGNYSELFMRHLDPARVAADRRWVPVDLDLSQFSGRRIRLILRTEASPPGKPPNLAYDQARWGAPRLVTN